MKITKAIVEVISFTFITFWSYEGISKVVNWSEFIIYSKHLPIVKPVWQLLAYGLPIFETGLTFLFLLRGTTIKALYLSIGALMLYIFWVMSVLLFTHWIFFPFHPLWRNPSWMQEILLSLGLCWGAFMAILLLNTNKNKIGNSATNKAITA